jgi:hypothetical protein
LIHGDGAGRRNDKTFYSQAVVRAMEPIQFVTERLDLAFVKRRYTLLLGFHFTFFLWGDGM